MTRIRVTRRTPPADRAWFNTLLAWRGFILLATGLMFIIFGLWLLAALAVACGILVLLWAQRRLGADGDKPGAGPSG